jgi:cysteine desulfurase
MYGSIAKIYIFSTLCHDFRMFSFGRKKKRIYLDYAAATPLHPEVRKEIEVFLAGDYGNPSAIHSEGLSARSKVEAARQKIATVLGIRPSGVLFTGSGTESNNLAILGLIKKLHREEGMAYSDMEVVTTRIEHPSISTLLPILLATGVMVKIIDVDSEGKISIPELERVLSPKTVLMTFAYANSEVGVVQPVSRIVRHIRQFEKKEGGKIYVHLDAAQAPLWLPCGLSRLGVDMMSLDAGKCNGPKGVGILASQNDFALLPITYGGGQEQGLRPGTENVMGIVGTAKALELAQKNYERRAAKVSLLRDSFIELLKAAVPGLVINGALGEERLANNVNISLPGFDTEYAVVYLDKHGIAASTKSACAGAGGGESKVVSVMTSDMKRARSTIRFSLGEETSSSDLKFTVEILLKFINKMSGLTK